MFAAPSYARPAKRLLHRVLAGYGWRPRQARDESAGGSGEVPDVGEPRDDLLGRGIYGSVLFVLLLGHGSRSLRCRFIAAAC